MKHNTSQKGFTIIETLVSVTILMIAVVGPLTIAHRGLMASVQARDQITASYLAQDAIEFVKNVKENNIRNGLPWLSGFEGSCSSEDVGNPQSFCVLDTVNGNPSTRTGIIPSIADCDNNNACALYSGDEGFTPILNGRPMFHRSLYIVTHGSGSTRENQATIIVRVWWQNGTIKNETIYESEFFNVTR